MAVQVRTTRRGRGALLARKAAIAAALAAAVWAMIYLRELRHMLSALGISTLDAPVQNIDALAAFPWAVTLKGYLAILYGVRLVMLVATAWVSLCLSHFCRSLQSAYLLCTGVVGLPALLTAFGVGALKWVSPIVPVSGAELLWGMGSGSFAHLIPWAVMLALGIAALALGYRKWVWN